MGVFRQPPINGKRRSLWEVLFEDRIYLVQLGLFGGTFNPIHLGHLRAAVEVREAFGLDKVLLIPSARPPHKTGDQMASALHRLEMVRLAVEGVPFLEASDVELALPGPSFTIETLRYFQKKFGRQSEIFFIVGQDAFSEITTWRSYRELFSTARFIVMTRPGARIERLEDFIHTRISEAYEYDNKTNKYSHPQWHPISCLRISQLEMSASQIRDNIAQGRSIRFLVPGKVHDFIEGKGLYR
jgi:nicotinate-nucleotide adenylyltransferase